MLILNWLNFTIHHTSLRVNISLVDRDSNDVTSVTCYNCNFNIPGLQGSVEMADAGAILALRALGWGTVYAVAGTSLICYGIWKLSGAKDVST